MKTYNDLYLTTRNTLKRSGVEAYAQEARILVACAADKTVAQLLRDLNLYTTPAVENTVTDYLARRLRGEPVAYITGTWEFYGLPMKVSPDVLIPRPDTETLVDAVKEVLVGYKMDARVLDLCCGSGCITCAVGHELPATKLVAVDLSASALEICRANIAMNRLSSRVICMQADATANPPLGIGTCPMSKAARSRPWTAPSRTTSPSGPWTAARTACAFTRRSSNTGRACSGPRAR